MPKKITINDTKQLKTILRKDDLFWTVFIAIFSLIFSYVLLIKNPKIVDVTITNIKYENNTQITTFEYQYKNTTVKDSLIKEYDNEEDRVLIEIFSEDNFIGKKIQIEFDRITKKPIGQVFDFEEINTTTWRDLILNTNVFLSIFAYVLPSIIMLVFYKERQRKYTILTNGFLVNGSYLTTKTVSNSDSTSYKHYYQYFVNEEKFETMVNSQSDISYKNAQVIYQINKPTNAIVFEHQTKRLQQFLKTNNFSINSSNTGIKHQNLKKLHNN